MQIHPGDSNDIEKVIQVDKKLLFLLLLTLSYL